ncbi:MAG: TRL domain-containing protein [Planctomycetota bacterium]|jgi:hypothetical protein
MKAQISVKMLILAAGMFMYMGCAVVPHVGILYTDATSPGGFDPTENQVFLRGKDYQVLGKVRGEATVENYAGLIAMGDYGIDTAYKDALKKRKGAHLLLDVHVDRHTMRILGFYIKGTTIVTGMAVKIVEGPAPRSSGGGDESWWGK